MNPTDQARKEARRKELKKNKKTRMAVRASVLKNKNVEQILNDLRDLGKCFKVLAISFVFPFYSSLCLLSCRYQLSESVVDT